MENAPKCNLNCEELHSVGTLTVHIKHKHKGVHDRKKKTIKCNVCGFRFKFGKNLLRHMRTHTGERPFKCTLDGCGMAFTRESNLKYHVKYKHNHERPFKCDFRDCHHSAKTSRDLSKHKKVHSDERPFACPNGGCSFRGKWKSDVTRHVKFVHNKATAYACTKCDYKATQNSNLKVHMRRHTSRRDFKCSHPQCTESFKSCYALKLHFSNRHRERSIQCDDGGCGQKFRSFRMLSNHKRNVHAKKSYHCPNGECSYSTSNGANLVRHMIVHNGRNEHISCSRQDCKYKGKNSRAVEEHMRRHKTLLPCRVSSYGRYARTNEASRTHLELHNPLDKPFQCPLCFKHFPMLDYMKRHCVVHTNEKPFKCGHCEFDAARAPVVKRHISSVHASIAFPFIVHLLDDHECLRCRVTLPSKDFVAHSKGHVVPIVMIERLEARWS